MQANNTYCAICRNELNERCIECKCLELKPSQCQVVTGKCLHKFHNHCMTRWLRVRLVCPMDNSIWIPLLNGASAEEVSVVENCECSICLERKMEIVFLPYGHCRFCIICANNILVNTSKCPICRETINNAIKLFY